MSQIIELANEKRREAIALLIAERQEIDKLLTQLGHIEGEEVGARKDRKPLTCSRCKQEGHTARTCPTLPEKSE